MLVESGAPTRNKQPFDPRDAEADELIKELQREKASLNSREQQLKEWEARLRAEQAELSVVTQRVSLFRTNLDKEITRVKEDEAVNVKRLAKMYGAMDPLAAANIFLQMDETSLVKIMMLMKDGETSTVLDALAKQGETGAKRAAALSERLRISAAPNKKPAP
jgi:flagellar motility protein MotE (MotC chaperone)